MKIDQNKFQEEAHERVSKAFVSEVQFRADVDDLDGAMLAYHRSGQNALALSRHQRDVVGYDIFNEFSAADKRAAGLEAQARRISSEPGPAARAQADRLRNMGASAEACAYGYDLMSRSASFDESVDRVIAEGTHISLTSTPGVDRAAHASLEGKTSDHASYATTDERLLSAKKFYASMSDEDLVKATRAIQDTICEDAILGAPGDRDAIVTARALMRHIENADQPGLLKTQKEIDTLAGWDESKSLKINQDHPLAIMSSASSSALRERTLEKEKEMNRQKAEEL